MGGRIAGRVDELKTVDGFLEDAADAPAGLYLEGEPGIGKTTLLNAAVERAADLGFTVLRAYGAAAEVAFAFGGVADLLSELDPGQLAALAAEQRAVLDYVLLRGVPADVDEHAVAGALLALVATMKQHSPVLIAIDDAQWLDSQSCAVIGFVLRRISGRVGLLASVGIDHSGHESTLPWLGLARPESLTRLRITALDVEAVHTLLTMRLGSSLSRPVVTRLHTLSGGNPFIALELARSGTTFTACDPLRLSPSLTALTRERLAAFDGVAGDVLLAIAAAGTVDTDALCRLLDLSADRVNSVVDTAEAAGVLARTPSHVGFTSSLLAAAVEADAAPGRRRAVHRRLADVVQQPALRARHLALAATSADAETLSALDCAADAARLAGMPAAAAEFAEMAIQLGDDTPERRIRAAGHHFRAGNIEATRIVIEPAIGVLPRGVMRAVGINIIAATHLYDESYATAAALLTEVLDDAGASPVVLGQTLLSLAMAEGLSGQFAASLKHADDAVTAARASASAELESQALAMRATLRCGQGLGLDTQGLQRAIDLEDPRSDGPVAFSALAVSALLAGWTGDLAHADEQMERVSYRCAERGAESDMVWVGSHRTFIDLWMGRYGSAADRAADVLLRAEQLGGSNVLLIAGMLNAAVAAYGGREGDARTWAQRALDISTHSSAAYVTDWLRTAMGFLEVSLGNYGDALDVLAPVLSRFSVTPGTEMFYCSYLPDAIEALVAVDDLAAAEPLIDALESNGAQHDRPWMRAAGARGRALWLAAKGDLDAAQDATCYALDAHQGLLMPFELARTQLLHGQLLRRRRRNTQAARVIRDAASLFDTIGSSLWAQRAHSELARINSRSHAGHGLSESERRVAQRAAAGMSNKEIAADLFLASKTVEMYLGNVYRKLGIRSRSQLTAELQRLG